MDNTKDSNNEISKEIPKILDSENSEIDTKNLVSKGSTKDVELPIKKNEKTQTNTPIEEANNISEVKLNKNTKAEKPSPITIDSDKLPNTETATSSKYENRKSRPKSSAPETPTKTLKSPAPKPPDNQTNFSFETSDKTNTPTNKDDQTPEAYSINNENQKEEKTEKSKKQEINKTEADSNQEECAGNPSVRFRSSHMIKTKGKLFYKKKGPFSKWKLYYVILDDSKMNMNFYKLKEDCENLSCCEHLVDLSYVSDIKPQKQRILQSNYPMKLQRRAGYSTVKLAAQSEEERARWITTIQRIMRKMKMMSEYCGLMGKRGSTLPNSTMANSDSETRESVSAPEDDDLIKPKRVSGSGIKVNPRQISSVKLKSVSSENKEKKIKEEKSDIEDDDFDPKDKFGVNLRRVQTTPRRMEREQSPEYIEFKQKYNSLSLSRKNKTPKLPLNENLTCKQHLREDISRDELKADDRDQLPKEAREPNRKRSPSPNIPLSKSVEAVMKNKKADTKVQSNEIELKLKFNVCHATSEVISFNELPMLEIDDNIVKPLQNGIMMKPDIIPSSESIDDADSLEKSKEPIVASKPNILEPGQIIPTIVVDEYIKENDTEVNCIENKEKDEGNVATESDTKDYDIVIELNTKTDDMIIKSDIKDDTAIVTNMHSKEDGIGIKIDTKEENITNKEVYSNEKDNIDRESETFKQQNIVTLSSKQEESQVISAMESEISTDESTTTTTKLEIDNKALQSNNQSICESSKSNNMEKDNVGTDLTIVHTQAKRVNSAGIMTEKQIESIISGNRDPRELNTTDFKTNSEIRLSGNSYMSQISTESDEPLPRLNFMGKGDRSSIGSASMKDSLSLKENRSIKSSASDDSLDQPALFRDKHTKTYNYNLPDSATRSSLVLPQFTTVKEQGVELLSETVEANISSLTENEDIENVLTDTTMPSKHLIEHNVNDSCNKIETVAENMENNSDDLPDKNKNVEIKEKTNSQKSIILTEDVTPSVTLKEQHNGSEECESENTKIVNEIVIDPVNMKDKVDNNLLVQSITQHVVIDHTANENFDDKSLKEMSDVNNDSIGITKEVNIQQSKLRLVINNETVSEENDILNEEAQDYYPSYGEEIKYRINNSKLTTIDDTSVRTSGISGLKEFLKESESDNSEQDIRSGISRLGHSPAIEKLRKEMQ